MIGRFGRTSLDRALHTSSITSTTLFRPSHHSTVALISGGIESTALLSYWTHWSHATEIIPLFVNYGQRNALKEEEAAHAVCSHLNLPHPEVVTCTTLGEQFQDMQRGEKHHDRTPFRNLMLLSLASAVAAEAGSTHIALACSKDNQTAPDVATSFLFHAEALLHALDPPLALLTPLAHLTPQHVVEMGDQVNAPWEKTWSCLGTGAEQCGVCGGCVAREEAFRGAYR